MSGHAVDTRWGRFSTRVYALARMPARNSPACHLPSDLERGTQTPMLDVVNCLANSGAGLRYERGVSPVTESWAESGAEIAPDVGASSLRFRGVRSLSVSRSSNVRATATWYC